MNLVDVPFPRPCSRERLTDSSEYADLKAELERHLSLETLAVKEARI